MNIFDKPVSTILESIQVEKIHKLGAADMLWPISDRNPFLMERDTHMELGGYPKESINIIVPSTNMPQILKDKLPECFDAAYIIGDADILGKKEKHVSFGKIVLLETEEIPDDKWYEFTQSELLTDSRIRLKDVMLRQSPTHYNLNMRVGKAAVKNGLNMEIIASTIKSEFEKLEFVKSATVIILVGESELYKKLLPSAEKIKEITLTLNHIFDGIDMDCGKCDLVEICNEVEGIRRIHRKFLDKRV